MIWYMMRCDVMLIFGMFWYSQIKIYLFKIYWSFPAAFSVCFLWWCHQWRKKENYIKCNNFVFLHFQSSYVDAHCTDMCDKSGFMWVLKSDWFCVAMLHDWLKKCAPIFHPIRGKTKIHHNTFARVFVCFTSATYNMPSFDCLAVLSVSFVISESDYFGFVFLTLIWKLPYLCYVISGN